MPGPSRWLLGLLLALLPLAPPSRAGDEFQVNQYTTSAQGFPAISHDSSGGFVVAWQSNAQDGSGYGVFARRFGSSGNALGAEFQVNQYTSDRQAYASVSHDTSGGFLVAWESTGQDGSGYGVFGRRYDSSGNALGGEFQVSVSTVNGQRAPKISHDSAGRFIVAWSSYQDGSATGVFARRFDSSGNGLGGEFQVNEYTSSYQAVWTISHDTSGGFVLAWRSDGQDGSFQGVFGRRYDSSGNGLGGEFQINQYTTSYQQSPTMSHDSSGGFVVVWGSMGQDGSYSGAFGRRYDSAGTALGGEFQVDDFTLNDANFPTISHDTSGGFVVAWCSCPLSLPGSMGLIYARFFDSSGNALGGRGQISEHAPGPPSSLLFPTISHDTSGGFVVVWMNGGQDGSSWGVFGRRVTAPQVVADDDLVVEGDNGTRSAVFWVGLSEPPILGGPVTVAHATADVTASAGSDYTLTAGSTVFLSGDPGPALVTVPVSGDTLYEADEVFFLDFTITGGWASTALGPAVGAIFNDDAPPSLSIGDVQVTEGDSGATTAQFVVSISTLSALPARVDFNTFNGTATAGEDYTAASGTLSFPAMSTGSQIASVLVTGDQVFEHDETFYVQLSNPLDAVLADAQGLGTIVNDDGNYLIATGPAYGGASRARRYSGQ